MRTHNDLPVPYRNCRVSSSPDRLNLQPLTRVLKPAMLTPFGSRIGTPPMENTISVVVPPISTTRVVVSGSLTGQGRLHAGGRAERIVSTDDPRLKMTECATIRL